MGRHGVAAFCPTLLSLDPSTLRAAVTRLGTWIHNTQHPRTGSALPLGIHLEGPYLSPEAKGAHPEGSLRPLDLKELESLRIASLDQIRILTLAPEGVAPPEREKLRHWARKHRIKLSMGHSRATSAQAREALTLGGFSGVTHAWNAMAFHHREPGLLGAALGRAQVSVEVIPDGWHVDPEVVRWVVELHEKHGPVCFVSDCVPASATEPGSGPYAFGPGLQVKLQDGASRLIDGTLAGGGSFLPQALASWVNAQHRLHGPWTQAQWRKEFRRRWTHVHEAPLKALGLPPALVRGRSKIRWGVREGQLTLLA